MDGVMRGKFSDNFRMARSGIFSEYADGTYGVLVIPKFAFLDQIWLHITQAYAGGASGSATVGWEGNAGTADPNGFMDTVGCAARTTGMKIMTEDAQPGSVGKWFNSGRGMITVTLAKSTDSTLLIGQVFARYSVIH